MKIKINVRNSDGEILETIDIKNKPQKFIVYRGRLLVKSMGTGFDYVERNYLELN